MQTSAKTQYQGAGVVLALAGLALVTHAAWLVWPPLASLAGGVGCLSFAVGAFQLAAKIR